MRVCYLCMYMHVDYKCSLGRMRARDGNYLKKEGRVNASFRE